MKRFFILFALSILTAVSCKKEPFIAVSTTVQEISADGGIVTFTVTANFPWSARTSEDWLFLSTPEGDILTVQVAKNPLTDERTGKIIISCEDKLLEVVVHQAPQDEVQPDDESPQIFTLIHNLSSFKSPVIFGFGITAITDWGDGTVEKYDSNEIHDYLSGGKHTISITATKALTVSLSDIVGVDLVDLSKF